MNATEPALQPGPAVTAGNSVSVAAWTIVSRVTGFLRVAAIAAVLGPTYLGNTFLATNMLPNVTFQLMGGALVGTLLIPPLVRALDRGDRVGTARLADGFLGVTAGALSAVALLLVAAGPLILELLALPVQDEQVADEQARVGWPLLAMLLPQAALYGVAAVGGAVMNANGRFALAAAAPALENLGVIATMGATAAFFGSGVAIEDVTTAQLLVMGLGTTGAVALHAGAQWWGARRLGFSLVPRAGWRQPEVRVLVRRATSALGQSALDALRVFAALVVANAVAGGVVAFSLALNFLYLPLAIGARPVALAFLPGLARLHHSGALQRFRTDYAHALAAALFLVVPAAVGYLILAGPLAHAASFGEMGGSEGVALLTVALAALAPAVVAEAWFLLATHASYARDDARAPFRAAVWRTGVALIGMLLAFALLEGKTVVLGVGLAVSAGSAVGAWHLGMRVTAGLPPAGGALGAAVLRVAVASVAMAGPAFLVALAGSRWLGAGLGDIVPAVAGGCAGAATFLELHRRWRSPELEFFVTGLGGLRRWAAR